MTGVKKIFCPCATHENLFDESNVSKSGCLCWRNSQFEGEFRSVPFGFQETDETSPERATQFVDNSIKTSKYTLLNFVPKNVFEQFRRVANIYFLLLSILMLIGDNVPRAFQTPVSPYSTLGTLVVVMSITLVKDGYEDIGRHASDNKANNAEVRVVNGRNGSVETKRTSAVRVGDLVMIHNMETVPADVILLSTSDEESQCYVETSNIDGETNLKLRSTPGNLGELFPDLESFKGGIQGSLECEHPNEFIHSFNARINVRAGLEKDLNRVSSLNQGEFPSTDPIPVSVKNLLIRGSVMRNTTWAIGVVVYTGKETKIMMNMRKVPSKLSSLERTVNKIIKLVFTGLGIFVILSVIYSSIVNQLQSSGNYFTPNVPGLPSDQTPRYLHSEGDADLLLPKWLGDIFSFLILYSNMVPISLYVTMELINVAQAYFITQDIAMYYEEDGVRALCRDSSLCQELGQVSYVFSDKTGTLTQNVMKFKSCILAEGKLFQSIEEVKLAVPSNPDLESLVRMMAVCHTVVPEKPEPSENQQGGESQIVYQSESPDEGALVEAAAAMGMSLATRRKTAISVVESGTGGTATEAVYEILAVNAFNSTRKRMSVVVRCPDGSTRLLCKGADNVILERCDVDGDTLERFNENLDALAASGLRTLAFASKTLGAEEYRSWKLAFDSANNSLEDREVALAQAAEDIEQGMALLGGTGIEDKLQDGVPETIEELRTAGINLWVLTGDKVATAINIGKACNVIQDDSLPVELRSTTVEELQSDLDKLLNMAAAADSASEGSGASKAMLGDTGRQGSSFRTSTVLQPAQLALAADEGCVAMSDMVLVVDGPALTVVMRDTELREKFLSFCKVCKSIIACRISPKQKAQIVRMVRKGVKPAPVTLAIGDGANDVTMIQEAHLGIGISGKEGRQAVNNSDFAIGQFRFLSRLMLVHGRWNYRRMSKIVLLCFYKNICLVAVLVLYNLFTLMSGMSLFDSWAYSGFNFFSGMPPVVIGMFDKELTEKQFQSMTYLYSVGSKGLHLSYWKMTFWMGRAVGHAAIISVMCFAVYGLFDSAVAGAGPIPVTAVEGTTSMAVEVNGVQSFGVIVYTSIYFVIMTTIGLETATWNFWVTFFFFGSMLFYIVSMLVLSSLPNYLLFHNVSQTALFHSFNWALAAVVTVSCLAVDILVRGAKRHFFHSDLMKTYHRHNGGHKDEEDEIGPRITRSKTESPTAIDEVPESEPLVEKQSGNEPSEQTSGVTFLTVTTSESEQEVENTEGQVQQEDSSDKLAIV